MNESSRLMVLSHEAPGDSWACRVLHDTDIAFDSGSVSDAKDLSYFASHKPELIVVEADGIGGTGAIPLNVPIITITSRAGNGYADALPSQSVVAVRSGDATGLQTAVRLGLQLSQARAAHTRLECELAYRIQFETLLTELSSRLVQRSSAEIEGVIREAVSMIGVFTNVDRCYLLQIDNTGTKATFEHEWCAAGITSHRAVFPTVDLANFPWTIEMYSRLRHIYIPRIEDLPDAADEERSFFKSTGLRSVLAVPLAVERRLLGVLGLATERSERTWADQDIRMLEALAQIIANALERKRNDAALLRVESRFREFADMLPVAIGIHAGSGFVYVNKAGEEISGFERTEVLERDVFSFLHPNDRETIREHLELLARTGEEKSREVRFFNKLGEERWAELQTRMIEFEGQQAYLLAAVDTTDRKRTENALRESEEHLRSVLENMPVMMNAYDSEGTIIVWNRECERVTGYRSDEIVGNSRALELLYPEAAYRGRMLDELKSRGVDFRDWELQLTCNNGTIRTISWASISGQFPVPGWAYWAIGVDLTERKQLEKQLLEISAREQIRIGQDLHDRLGQLLTGLGFKAQSLAHSLNERGASEAQTAAALVKLVSESIVLTRSLARGLHPVELESNGLMAALEELASQAEDLYGVPTQFSCEEPVLVYDNSAATHLYRIAQEAVTNAAKHGTPSFIEIGLASEDRNLVLSIEDDGTGLGRTTASNGGLGLNIMVYRASVIDGKLEWCTRPGGGTRVVCRVRLPKPVTDASQNDTVDTAHD